MSHTGGPHDPATRRIFAVHEYVLKAGAGEGEFRRAIEQAEERGLLKLPGLAEYCFLRGVKGNRTGRYAAIWVFESREAWERRTCDSVMRAVRAGVRCGWGVEGGQVMLPAAQSGLRPVSGRGVKRPSGPSQSRSPVSLPC